MSQSDSINLSPGIWNNPAFNNCTMSGDLTVSGNTELNNLTVTGTFNGGTQASSLIPDTDNVYNLGSLSNRWANLFLGQNATISGNVTCDNLTSGNDINATNANISGNMNANIANISSASNQITLGNTNTLLINAVAPLASRIYSIQDAGADCDFVMSNGNQSIAGSKIFTSDVGIIKPNTSSTLLLETVGSQASLRIEDGVGTSLNDISGGGSIKIIGNSIETNNNILDNGSGVISASSLNLSDVSNQIVLGSGNTVTLNAIAPTSNITVEFPDVLNPTNTVMYLNGTQVVNSVKFWLTKVFLAANGNMLQFQNNGVGNTVNITCPNPSSGNRIYSIIDSVADADFMLSTKSTVTQITSATTAVTINGSSGVITTFNQTAAALTATTFTVNNSVVSSTSVILANICNYAGTLIVNGSPTVTVNNVTAGAFDLVISNLAPVNALNGVLKISFIVA